MAEMTQGERVAVVETKIDHIIVLLEAHIIAPSCVDCKLTSDVVTCQTNIMWMKRVGYVVGASIISFVLAAVGFDKINF